MMPSKCQDRLELVHLANDLQLSVLDWECCLMATVELADRIKYFVMPCGYNLGLHWGRDQFWSDKAFVLFCAVVLEALWSWRRYKQYWQIQLKKESWLYVLSVSYSPFTIPTSKWRGGAEQVHLRVQSHSKRLLFLVSWQGGMQASVSLYFITGISILSW